MQIFMLRMLFGVDVTVLGYPSHVLVYGEKAGWKP